MSREGDRLTIDTAQGPCRIERTQRGVSIHMPGPQAELSAGVARRLGQAINALSQGSPFEGSQGGQQGGGQNWSRDRS